MHADNRPYTLFFTATPSGQASETIYTSRVATDSAGNLHFQHRLEEDKVIKRVVNGEETYVAEPDYVTTIITADRWSSVRPQEWTA